VVGALYSMALFSEEVGEATVFVPVDGPVRTAGRVRVVQVPAADVAVVVHSGTERGEDQSYGELGTFVAERGIGVAGPVREYYLDGAIEICWPVSSVASA
jgi:effector-binding domain-containing protein